MNSAAGDPLKVLFLDTSALVRRYVNGSGRQLVLSAMAEADAWCASAICRSEVMLALRQLVVHPRQQGTLWSNFREDWAAFWVVPVDGRCLAAAVDIGAAYGLRTVDAVHLAAAERLPRPLRFATFDRRQAAWEAKRDRACDHSADREAKGGTMRPMVFSSCRAAATEARTKQLQRIERCADIPRQ